MRKQFNVRFFAILVGITALLVFGVHFLHRYQVKRNAKSLLDQAHQAEEFGRLNQARDLLSTYLIYYPDDAATLAKYGVLLDQQSALNPRFRPRALAILEKALRLNRETDPDLRRRVVRIAMELGRFSDAKDHLDILLAAVPNDGELEGLRGRCQEAYGEFIEAKQDFERAIKHAPNQSDAYLSLAFLLRGRLSETADADKRMEEVVRKNPQSFKAFLAQVTYYTEFKDFKRAAIAIEEAQKLAPNQEDVILSAANLKLANSQPAKPDLQEARALLERGIRLYPQNPRLYMLLAQVEEQSERRAQAITVLRQGLEALPENSDLVWTLTELLIANGEKAKEQIELLSQLGFSQGQLTFLQARIHLHDGEWMEAIRILEQIRPELARQRALALQGELLLGQAYLQVGDTEEQYASYRRASEMDSDEVTAYQGMASALVEMGRIDDALEVYQRILPIASSALIEITRITILRNLRLPPHRRNWNEVEQAMTACSRLQPLPTDLPILRADALAGQGEFIKARDVLNKALLNDPGRVELWTALASLADRDVNSNQALTILNEAQAKLGDKAEIRQALAAYWARRKGAMARQALAQLETGWDQAKFPSEAKANLLRALAQSYAQQDDLQEVGRIWKQLAEIRPWDLGVQLVLFDLAFHNGDEPAMLSIIANLKELEKSEGALWQYAQASRLIWQQEQKKKRGGGLDDTPLADARQLLAKAGYQRPNWGRIARREGQIDDLQGNRASAIKNYLRAINLGLRNPSLIQRTVQLLNDEQRFLEGFEVAQRIQRLSGHFLEDHDFLQAMKLAREAASDQSKDFRDHLWLGQVLSAAVQSEKIEATERGELTEEAEKAFQQAAKLSGELPDPWVALISFLAQARTPKEAAIALSKMESKFSQAKAPLALAICHEIVGSQAKAQQLYQQAAAAKKDDVTTLRTVAGYYLRTGRIKEAEELLTTIMELKTGPPEDAAWAKRTLSIVLAAERDYQSSQKALAQLNLLKEGNDSRASADDTPEDLRTRALVLAAQSSSQQRRRAIPLLETLMECQPAPDDQLLLAHCYEMSGDWPKAKIRLTRLLATNSDNPKYLVSYALALLRHQELDECQKCLEKLEHLPDDIDSFALTEVKARLLVAQHRPVEAVAQVRDYVQGKALKPEDLTLRLELGAGLLESLSQTYSGDQVLALEAEKMYRECISRQPKKVLLLATFLGRQGRVGEALDCCEQAWKSCAPLQVAQVAIVVLHQGPANPPQYERVEHWLDVALAHDPKAAADFMVLQADLRMLQGNYAEAIATYRQVLMRDNRNATALNNLAWILALKQGKGTEALDLAQEAVRVMGPNPSLLDTRGVIYLTLGRADMAVKDLETAATGKPRPTYCFHLAWALLAAKNPDRAKQAYRRAMDLGFNPDRLDPLERGEYSKIRAELEMN